jgi:O-antigen/teichoic acid export membrane protein
LDRVRPATWNEWWLWLREAAPLALGAALDTIYFRIDIVMLSVMASATAVANYNIGYKFSDLLGAIPIAVATPALTYMVASWPSDVGAFRRMFRHTVVLLAVVAVGACAGFLVYADPVITAVYGQRYAVASGAAQLLFVGQALHFFTIFSFTTLVAVHRNRLYPVAMLLGVVVNVSLNLVLIPRYSYVGSGFATVVTESLVLLALGAGVFRIPGLRPLPWRSLAKTAGAGVVAAGVGLALVDRVPWPVGLATVGVVYVALVHGLSPNGPGGLRAFAGEPHDDLASAIDLGIDRPDLGTGLPE